jgi:hypothetical protein
MRHDVKYLDIRKSCVWGWFGCVLHKCFNGFPVRFIVWVSCAVCVYPGSKVGSGFATLMATSTNQLNLGTGPISSSPRVLVRGILCPDPQTFAPANKDRFASTQGQQTGIRARATADLADAPSDIGNPP